MGSERRTVTAGYEAALHSGTRRVAVCAGDDELADRIMNALGLAGHRPAGRCLGLLELTEDFGLLEVDLVVAVVDPVRDEPRLAFLCRELGGVPLIAVVPHRCRAQSGRLLASEVDGVVLADEVEGALGPAIASVLADQLCVPLDALSALAGPVFSHREKQVLRLLLAGLTNSEIAGQLYLSESTVKSHLSSSFRKLGVSSRAEILRRARSDSALGLPFHFDQRRGAPTPVLT